MIKEFDSKVGPVSNTGFYTQLEWKDDVLPHVVGVLDRLENEEEELFMGEETVSFIQSSLRALGHEKVEVTGSFDNRTLLAFNELLRPTNDHEYAKAYSKHCLDQGHQDLSCPIFTFEKHMIKDSESVRGKDLAVLMNELLHENLGELRDESFKGAQRLGRAILGGLAKRKLRSGEISVHDPAEKLALLGVASTPSDILMAEIHSSPEESSAAEHRLNRKDAFLTLLDNLTLQDNFMDLGRCDEVGDDTEEFIRESLHALAYEVKVEEIIDFIRMQSYTIFGGAAPEPHDRLVENLNKFFIDRHKTIRKDQRNIVGNDDKIDIFEGPREINNIKMLELGDLHEIVRQMLDKDAGGIADKDFRLIALFGKALLEGLPDVSEDALFLAEELSEFYDLEEPDADIDPNDKPGI